MMQRESLPFGRALELLWGGHRVARKGWSAANAFVYLVPGSTFSVSRPPLKGILKDGTVVQYRPHLDMHCADGSCVPWTPTQLDLLTDDWHLVP